MLARRFSGASSRGTFSGSPARRDGSRSASRIARRGCSSRRVVHSRSSDGAVALLQAHDPRAEIGAHHHAPVEARVVLARTGGGREESRRLYKRCINMDSEAEFCREGYRSLTQDGAK